MNETIDEHVAFELWRKPKATALADKALAAHQDVNLRMARSALRLPMHAVANKMGISQSGYANLEARCEKGEISLAKLAEAAQALGCECVITIRPTMGETFAKRLWSPLIAVTRATPWVQRARPQRRVQVWIAAANEISETSRFKKKAGWSRRRV
jgi:transcriptional regulator with XRE-family HTH domain